MSHPDFIVAGTARAGTTSLHYYLRTHPGIFLPKQKEPSFYSFAAEKIDYKKGKFVFAVTDPEKYSELFADAGGLVKGDISTPYLYLHEKTISRIRKYHPAPEKLKIIIILRNPSDRAYSQYLWKRRDGREELSFEEALHAEEKRMNENYSFDYFYAHRGLYYKQVRDYLENFKFVRIFQFDDFKNNFEATMKDVCSFIGVDDQFHFIKREKTNSSSIPKFAAAGRLLTVESKIKFKILNMLPDKVRMGIKETFTRWNSTGGKPEPMSGQARKWLNEYYREDILNLQELLHYDLSDWLNG